MCPSNISISNLATPDDVGTRREGHVKPFECVSPVRDGTGQHQSRDGGIEHKPSSDARDPLTPRLHKFFWSEDGSTRGEFKADPTAGSSSAHLRSDHGPSEKMRVSTAKGVTHSAQKSSAAEQNVTCFSWLEARTPVDSVLPQGEGPFYNAEKSSDPNPCPSMDPCLQATGSKGALWNRFAATTPPERNLESITNVRRLANVNFSNKTISFVLPSYTLAHGMQFLFWDRIFNLFNVVSRSGYNRGYCLHFFQVVSSNLQSPKYVSPSVISDKQGDQSVISTRDIIKSGSRSSLTGLPTPTEGPLLSIAQTSLERLLGVCKQEVCTSPRRLKNWIPTKI